MHPRNILGSFIFLLAVSLGEAGSVWGGEGGGGGASLDETLKIASKLSIERQEAGSEVCTLFSSSTL